MNDPGLDDSIQDAANGVRHMHQNNTAEEIEQEKAYVDSSGWWFASTAFPLIAGTFGPMANAFNVCALSEYWRELVNNGTTQDTGPTVKDPTWLTAINAVAVFFGVVGNTALLFNMAGRLRFSIAQPVTIFGFMSSALILLGLVGKASTHSFRKGIYVLTQAYFYAAFAAGVYFVIACLMIVTVVGALLGKYDRKFNLTPSQRTLMLQTIMFMFYLLIGALIWKFVEGWRFLDAVFWADFTLLTIGLGQPAPTTHLGRSLLLPYGVGGIFAVGLIISSIRSMLLEAGKNKIHARATEKRREQIIKLTNNAESRSIFGRDKQAMKYHEKHSTLSEIDRRRLDFHTMRNIGLMAHRKGRWVSLSISTFAAGALWLIGAIVFWKTEFAQEWTYFESVYFSYTTLITLGYGDFSPSSNCGRVFFVFWSLLAIPTLTILISDMGDTVIKGVAEATDFLGSLTVLPGEKGSRRAMQKNLARMPREWLRRVRDRKNLDADLALADAVNMDEGRYGTPEDLLLSRLSDEDRKHWDKYKDHGNVDEAAKDVEFYHFVLSSEIKHLLGDVDQTSEVRYTYDEWAYFLKLLGHDERDTRYHASPPQNLKKDDSGEPEIGTIFDHDDKPKSWSWLGLRSPLMSRRSESEWILHQLLRRLSIELHKPRRLPGGRRAPQPPVTLDLLREAEAVESSDASRDKERVD